MLRLGVSIYSVSAIFRLDFETPWPSGRLCFAFYYSNCFCNVSRRAMETEMPIFIYKNKYLFLQAYQEHFILDILMHLIRPPISC